LDCCNEINMMSLFNSFMTMATFSSWNSIEKAHHVDFVASSNCSTIFPIQTFAL
jgi:hypothetical protein